MIATAGLAVLALLSFQLPATAATPRPIPIPESIQLYYHFMSKHPHFSKTDSNGKLSVQVSYGSKGLPVAWSFRLSKGLQAIAVSKMDCTAKLQGTKRYHDHHNIL